MRECEACHIKMPAWKPRVRHPETGALVCTGCHPNKPGSEGRPVGFHGSKTAALSCASCSAPMGEAGLIRVANLLVCADGCKSAATHPLTGEPMEDEGRYEVVLNGEVIEGPYQSQADAEAAASRRDDGSHARRKASSRKTAAWSTEQGGEYHEIEAEGVGQATISMEFKTERATEGGFSASAQPTGRWEYDAFLYDLLPTRNQGVANTLDDAKAKCEAYLAGGQMTLASTAMQVVAHDSGDGKTIYHCPFCGAGQTVKRSDGTVECGFCKTYFTVQVQPEHASMPQTDPATGQPLGMPGMPGDPTSAQAPNPTPTQTNAPAGTGDFAPAGSGGAEGFAPAGQGPMEQFAPAGSARAASRRTAAAQTCVYDGAAATHLVSDEGDDDWYAVCAACEDSMVGEGAVVRLLDKTATRKTAWDNDEWDEQYDPQGEACPRCGGDGEIDGPCEACDGTGLATTASKRTAAYSDCTCGTYSVNHKDHALSCPLSERSAHPTEADSATRNALCKVCDGYGMDENDAFCSACGGQGAVGTDTCIHCGVQILWSRNNGWFHTGGSRLCTKTATRKTAENGAALEGYTVEKRGEEYVLLHPRGHEVARSTDKALLEDYRLQRDSSKKTAMYLTPDQVALPESSYLAHLAIRFAGDKGAVIHQVRNERAAR